MKGHFWTFFRILIVLFFKKFYIFTRKTQKVLIYPKSTGFCGRGYVYVNNTYSVDLKLPKLEIDWKDEKRSFITQYRDCNKTKLHQCFGLLCCTNWSTHNYSNFPVDQWKSVHHRYSLLATLISLVSNVTCWQGWVRRSLSRQVATFPMYRVSCENG